MRIFQSETYSLWDTLFWDKGHSGTDGVDYNSTGWSNARCTLTRDTETKLVWTGESNNGSYYRSLSEDTGLCIEFDINYAKYRGTDVLFSLLNTWNIVKSISRTDLGLSQNTWHHLKIELKGENSTISNTTDDTVITFDSTNVNRFLLSLNHANDVIMYKNFKVYSI